MAAILKEEPPELSGSGRNISPALDHVVKHCLEKDRDNRFQSAKDIAFALSERLGAGDRAAHSWRRPRHRENEGPRRGCGHRRPRGRGRLPLAAARTSGGEAGGVKRVAVLPFENLGAPEDDYFADGIADEVRGKLTSLPGVEVIARGSSTPYKKTTKTPKQIAQELDVKYLLTATVRWQKGAGASRVHVSPELVEVRESGAPASRWQQPFDAALTDVFQVQSDIASRVAQALGVALGAGEEKRLSEKPTQNLAAYDAFLKGEEASKGIGSQRSGQPAEGARVLRAGRGAGPWFRAGVGEVSRANSIPLRSAPHARAGGARPAGSGEGRGARPGPPRGLPGARRLPAWVLQ